MARFLVPLTPCLSRLPHGGYLGGVFALRPVHYLRINGFPSTHWGWDREDSDIAARWGGLALETLAQGAAGPSLMLGTWTTLA